jgi:hypothetical protein
MAGKAGQSGGKRPNAGRRKGKIEDEIAVQAPEILAPIGKGDEKFFTEILNRIGEGDIGQGPRKRIENAVDYALAKLYCGDKQIEAMLFKMVVEHKYGKPAQPVISKDTREDAPELDFGNLAMPAGPKPGAAGKPN